MKKISLLLLPIYLIASQSSVDLKIVKLESELKMLKEEMLYQQEELDERMPIIESAERKFILDRVDFSPELRLRLDKFDYKSAKIEDGTPLGENTKIHSRDSSLDGLQRRDEFSKDFDLASSLRFRLNMSMNLDDIKFYGRMLYMNSSQSNERVCILSRDIKTGISGSAFDVDRAYIDYSIYKNSLYASTLTFGILPTSGGTPMQYAQEKQRNSMFPALVFDMNTYGIILTQKLFEDTFIRLIAAKPYTLAANFYPYQCNRENIDDANILGIYADTQFDFFGEALLSFGLNILNQLKAHPYLGPDVSSLDSNDLGSIFSFGMGLDIEEFGDTPTTLFLHTALSNPHGNQNRDDYQIVSYNAQGVGVTADNRVGFTEAKYASGTLLKENGYALYLGAKYEFNAALHLGAEYNYGSKYWFSATQGAEDMFNKLATRGSAYELYWIWNYHTHLNAKLSYLNIHEAYTGSGWHFGEPAKKDATQNIASLSLEAKF